MLQRFHWHNLLHPFWRHFPYRLRRALIWVGSAKFLLGVAAICQNPRGQVLLLEHRFHNEVPWGLPGGWVGRGEEPLPALLREVQEETGFAPRAATLVSVSSDGTWVEVVYACHVPDQEPTIQASEVRGYRWVDPAAPGVPLMPAQADALARFAAERRSG